MYIIYILILKLVALSFSISYVNYKKYLIPVSMNSELQILSPARWTQFNENDEKTKNAAYISNNLIFNLPSALSLEEPPPTEDDEPLTLLEPLRAHQ